MKNFCKKYNLTEKQFFGKKEIGGYLDLGNLTSIPEGFNPTVGGSLYLGNLTSIPEGFNPTVGGSLYLGNLTSIPEGFNPTVGGYLDLGNLTSIPEGFNPTVGGSLDLGNLTSIPEGFNPTVGGSLYLRNLTSIPEGFNPTVGGSLYLGNLTSIPEGFNPTVGGSLDLGNLTCDVPRKPYGNPILSWENGKYILCDGIFTEVLSKKKGHYFVRKLDSKEKMYIVTDGKNTHAHGKTLKQANSDLQFKIISEKLKNEPIERDTLLTVKHYRLITGACDSGARDFMQRNGLEFEVLNPNTDFEETKEINPVKAIDLLPLLVKDNAYGVEKFKSLVNF